MALMNFSWDEFVDAAKKAGLWEGGFSDADLKLAQNNPNAGMELLQYKINYGNATTDEERAAANKGAEGVRMQEGGYYGGVTGMDYYRSPNALPYANGQDATTGSFGYSEYSKTSPYLAAIQSQTQNILNTQPFSYDKDTDPLYGAYKKQYLREGQRAMQDTLGAAAANTGGIASSYAVGAAQQANNYYNSQLNDKLVDLYNAAYNRYTTDLQNKYNQLNMLQTQENNEYNRWLNDQQMAYQKEQDAYTREWNEKQLAASQAQNEANLAWKQQELANSNYQAQLDRESKERMNAQDNSSAYARALLSKSGSETTENEYNGSIKPGDYNDYKKLYPDGNITNWNDYINLVNKYNPAAVRSAGFSVDPMGVAVTVRDATDANKILEAIGATPVLEYTKWKAKQPIGSDNRTRELYELYVQEEVEKAIKNM